MEFSGEPTTMFLCPNLPETVPVNRIIATTLAELRMISEGKEYLDKTDHGMVAENNLVGTHWTLTSSRTTSDSEENNPSGCPSGAGPLLNTSASGSGSTSRALEELQCGVQKESTLCFFRFAKSELERAGMNSAAEEFQKRTEAKTPAEVEELGSIKLWNHLNLPYNMLLEMAHLGFTVSQTPVVYVPPVTASFVTPAPGWTPAPSGINPEIGVAIEGPIEAAPFADEPLVVDVQPNQEWVCVSATNPEICLANSNKEVKAERAAAAVSAAAEGSGGKRKAEADVGDAVELSALKKKKGHTDSAEVSSSEILP